jgi:hypothetical protein
MQYKLPSIILVISASLSLVAAIAIIPIYHQANAKECNDSNCSDKQSSDSNSNDDSHDNSKHSDSNNDDGNNAKQQKDKTPFVLAQPMPFP